MRFDHYLQQRMLQVSSLKENSLNIRILINAYHFSQGDTLSRYKKSILGPLWLSLGTVVSILGLGLLWGVLLKQDLKTFIPSLAAGLIIWQFISSTITESASCYVRNRSVIKNIKTENDFFCAQVVMKGIINFGHNMVVYLLLVLYLWGYVPLSILWMVPVFILVVLNLFWIVSIVALVGARYGDIEYALNSFMPLLFFLSPVLYKSKDLGPYSDYIYLNPATYFIEILRDPMVNGTVDVTLAAIMLCVAMLGFWAKKIIYKKFAKNLPFWV